MDVAGVVVIAKRCAAAGKALRDSRTHLSRNIFELPFAEIFVNQPRVLESLANILPVNFGIHVPVDLHNVRPAVVVVIDEAAAPRDVLIIDPETRSKLDVAETSVAVVVVQIASVVRKI